MLAISTPTGRLPLESYVSHGRAAGIHWTKVREAVLHLFWSAAKPLGAYEAAERLSRPGHPVHPTSVYRCLRCLVDAGLVLRIVTWNKYLLSPDPGIVLWGALLCRDCRSCMLFDLSDERPELGRELEERRFTPRSYAAECEGRCGRCSQKAAFPAPGHATPLQLA